jgi:hypothetical protein
MGRPANIAILVGVAGAIVLACAFAPPKHGPLADYGCCGFGFPAKPGEIVTTDAFVIPTHGAPIVLLGVRPLHPEESRGVTLRFAVGTGRFSRLGDLRGWHPAKWRVHPVAGYATPPHTYVGVLVGTSSKEPGVHWIHGFSSTESNDIELCVGMRTCPSP